MAAHQPRYRCTACALVAGIALQTLAAVSCAAAEVALRDPTQPPRPVPAVPAAAIGVAPAAPAWPRLQSVKISATGASSALIDGRVVRVGERVGAATLVRIDAQGVLLRGVHFEQQMALFPGIVKTVDSKEQR